MRSKSRKQTLWVLTVPSLRDPKKREFLYTTNSDWGPSHLTTADVLEAETFGTKEYAMLSDAARGWYDVDAVQVEVRTIVKFVDG